MLKAPCLAIVALTLSMALAACGAPSAIPPAPCDPTCGPDGPCPGRRCSAADGGTAMPGDGSAVDAAPEATADALEAPPPDVGCALRANATAARSGDGCVYTCVRGYGDCDGNPANGCEVQVLGDSAVNCGACGRVCDHGPNSWPVCFVGLCRIACIEGTGDCDGVMANGCETVTVTNDTNCGACGNNCGSTRVCVRSACIPR